MKAIPLYYTNHQNVQVCVHDYTCNYGDLLYGLQCQPYYCFPMDSNYNMYIYILLYIFAPVSHIHVCIVYVHVVKEVISLRGARSISGQACNRMCTRALQTSRKNSSYVKTVTKSCSSWNIFLNFYNIL